MARISNFRSISIAYFRSFARPQRFAFPLGAGFYRLSGRNEQTPALSPNASGKCLHGSTILSHARTGERLSIKKLVESGRGDFEVWALNERMKLVPAKVIAAEATGKKQLLKVTLRSGISHLVSEDHPIMTGWFTCTKAKNLKPGQFVAAPRKMRPLEPKNYLTVSEARLAANIKGFASAFSRPAVKGAANFARTLLYERCSRLPGNNAIKLCKLAKSDLVWTQVVSVEKAGIDQTYDIQIDSPLHLYALDGFITHNSSLWDALSWILFGKTARNLGGKDVANWDHPGLCHGEVDMRGPNPDIPIIVARSYAPNSLTLQIGANTKPKPVTQEEITKLLGVDHAGFLATVLMGQFNPFFFDLSPAGKLKLFADALGLNIWVDLSLRASEGKKQATEDLRKAEQYKARALGRLDSQTVLLERLSTKLRDWHENRKKFKAELKGKYLEAKRKSARAEVMYVSARETHRLAIFKEQGKAKKVRLAKIAMSQSRVEMDDALLAQKQAEIILEKAISELAETNWRKLCPVCRRPLQKVAGLARKNLEEARLCAQSNAEEKKHSALLATARFNDAKKEYEICEEAAYAAQRSERVTQAEVEQAKAKALERRFIRDKLIAEMKKNKHKGNPYEWDLAFCKKEIKRAEARVAKFGGKADSALAKITRYKFWAGEFRQVRLWIIEESLKQLEIEVGNALAQLGLGEWRVKFEVERATLSGGMVRGFNVLIRAPGTKKAAKWESWSGGETQRLRIAGAIGLSMLIRARQGMGFKLEVWDEPTQFMNEAGVEALLEFFEGRAREEKRQIWLTDHRSLKSGAFDGTVHIVRKPNGMSVVRGSLTTRGTRQGASKRQDIPAKADGLRYPLKPWKRV